MREDVVELQVATEVLSEDDSNNDRKKANVPKRLLHIDWLRATAITMVILVHICQESNKPTDMPLWESERNDGIVYILCTFGITIFFFCGGMVQTFKRNTWVQFSWKRFQRLILPFIIAIPIVLQPTQFISCQYGMKLRRANCMHMYPSTDSPGYPEPGEFTMYSYPEFVNEWFKTFMSSDIVSIFHWLWFLPLFFFTDILNFVACRWMLFFFEGGWYKKADAPGVYVEPKTKTLKEWVHLAIQKKDLLFATGFTAVWQILSTCIFPTMVFYWIGYWVAVFIISIGLIYLRRTKRWQIWWVVKKIFPALTCFYALFWPEDKSEFFVGLQFFVLFSNQGYLQQLVYEFQKIHCTESASKICMAADLVFVVFMIALCAPTSGDPERPWNAPMYRGRMGLAFLATIGNWITIQLCEVLFRAYYSRRGNSWVFFHFTQFPMILYVYHMLFIIIATTWVTNPLVDYPGSYPVIYIITFLFSYGGSGLVYAFFLYFRVTRTIFGVRQFNKDKDTEKNDPERGYQTLRTSELRSLFELRSSGALNEEQYNTAVNKIINQ